MDYKIVWSNRGLSHFEAIVSFISADNPTAARKVAKTIIRKTILLSQHPRLGKIFTKLERDDVRETPAPPYRIIYQVIDETKVVSIVAIWHGAREEPEFL